MKSLARDAGARLIGTILLTIASIPGDAHAYPGRLREGTKPLELRAGTGLSLGLNGAGLVGRTGIEFLYHSSGTARGPAFGAIVHGQYFTRPNVRGGGVVAGPLLAWDIRLARGLGLYLSPSASIAYGLWNFDGSSYRFIDVQFGATLRLVLDDSWEVYLRPVHFDMLINRGFIAFYDATIGIGYNF